MATAAAGNDAAVKGGGKKKLIIIVAIVLVVVLVGVAALLMMKKKSHAGDEDGAAAEEKPAAAAHAKPGTPPTFVPLDPFDGEPGRQGSRPLRADRHHAGSERCEVRGPAARATCRRSATTCCWCCRTRPRPSC